MRALIRHLLRSPGWRDATACQQHRPFSITTARHDLQGYTADALDAPLFRVPPKPREIAIPTTLLENERKTDEPDAEPDRIILRSKLQGPGQQRTQAEIDAASTLIAGILVPPKPTEPENCCMSGCVNCVWDQFRDEMEDWALKSVQARRAQARMSQARIAAADGRATPGTAASMDDDGGGSETNWEPEDSFGDAGGQDLFAGIPVGIREFMKLEKKMKRQMAAQAAASASKPTVPPPSG